MFNAKSKSTSQSLPEKNTNAGLVTLSWDNLRRKNPELPPRYSLTAEHEAELLASGINKVQAAIAGIFSADSTTSKALIGYSYSGLMFPYFDRNGCLYKWADPAGQQKPFMRLKPDSEHNSKAKYLSPKDAPVFVYVPITADYKWADSKGAFKSNQNILVTEGEKKALCATLNDSPCLGLGGVNSFKTGLKPATGSDEDRNLGFFIDELNVLALQSLTLVYDSDIIAKPQIQQAIKSFAYTLAGGDWFRAMG
jgi:Domain of unknown function (DUF3854)